MSITLLVFFVLLIIFTIAHHLGYDPVWFTMLVVAASAASYLMTLAPIHITWWIIGKLGGQ